MPSWNRQYYNKLWLFIAIRR